MDRPWRYPSAYDRDENIVAMVARLARGDRTAEWKVEALAQAVHRATPWAGRPIPWDEITERHREESRGFARWALEHA